MIDERALSNLLHETLDGEDVAAPFQRLAIELDKPGAARRRRGRRIFMTRNRLVLLAAALVLLLSISVLVSARLFGGINQVGQTTPAGPEGVAQLLARPLILTHHQATDNCTDGPYTGGDLGTGPVYGNGTGPISTAWGSYWDVYYFVTVGQKGPIVVRGRDPKLGTPVVFLGKYGVGDPYGTDTFDGVTQNQYTAVAFEIGHASGPIRTLANPPGNFTEWDLTQGIKSGWTGCFGFQVDGPDFTETFYTTG